MPLIECVEESRQIKKTRLVRILDNNNLFTLVKYKEMMLLMPNIDINNVDDVIKEQIKENKIKII